LTPEALTFAGRAQVGFGAVTPTISAEIFAPLQATAEPRRNGDGRRLKRSRLLERPPAARCRRPDMMQAGAALVAAGGAGRLHDNSAIRRRPTLA